MSQPLSTTFRLFKKYPVIYQNPAGSSFSILFKELKADAVQLVMTGIMGKVAMADLPRVTN